MMINKSIYKVIKNLNLVAKIDYASFFRISVSFLALTSVLSYGDDYYAIFSGSAIPLKLINEITIDKEYFAYRLYKLFFINGDSVQLFFLLKWIYVLFLFFLLIGFLSNISASFAFFFNLIIYFNSELFLYGYDIFMYNSLLFCILFRVSSKLSIDSFFFIVRPSAFLLPILRIHLCICYLFSGLSKAFDGVGWWNGQKMINAVHYSASSKGLWFADFFTNFPIIPLVLGFSTVMLEVVYPIFIWPKKTRKYVLWITILMHVSIVILLDLLAFSAIMIIWNLAAYYNFKGREDEIEKTLKATPTI